MKIKEINQEKTIWTETGKEYTTGKEKEIKRAIDAAEWKKFEEGQSVAATPGMAINQIRKEMRMPKPSSFAISPELAPYGLIGLYLHYKNADVQAFFLDAGFEVVSIVQKVTYK